MVPMELPWRLSLKDKRPTTNVSQDFAALVDEITTHMLEEEIKQILELLDGPLFKPIRGKTFRSKNKIRFNNPGGPHV